MTNFQYKGLYFTVAYPAMNFPEKLEYAEQHPKIVGNYFCNLSLLNAE